MSRQLVQCSPNVNISLGPTINTHAHVSTKICVRCMCINNKVKYKGARERFIPPESCLPMFTTSLKKCLTTVLLSELPTFSPITDCWLKSRRRNNWAAASIKIPLSLCPCWLERKDKPSGKEAVNLYAASIAGQANQKEYSANSSSTSSSTSLSTSLYTSLYA